MGILIEEAAAGKGPYHRLSVRELEDLAATNSPDLAGALAELICRNVLPPPKPHAGRDRDALDQLYTRLSWLGGLYYSDDRRVSRWARAEAVETLRDGLQWKPSKHSFVECRGNMSRSDVDELFTAAAQPRSPISPRARESHVPRLIAEDTAAALSVLAAATPLERKAALAIASSPPLPTNRNLASREHDLRSLDTADPEPYVFGWWALHLAGPSSGRPGPDRCLEPGYLVDRFGDDAALFTTAVDLDKACAAADRWAVAVAEVVESRRALPARVIAAASGAAGLLHDLDEPTGLARDGPVVREVSHLLAEYFVSKGVAHDLGPAPQVPSRLRERFRLAWDGKVWPQTTLAALRAGRSRT